MRFYSRKNQVTLEAGEVVKRHTDKTALLREAEMLERLYRAGLAVPAIVCLEADVLRMEYIPGDTYYAHTEIMTTEKADALAVWLMEYRRITGLLKGDVNLRNFLWTGKCCFGVDFEDVPVIGEPEIDMGKMIAFVASYRPSFTPGKAECAHLLLKAFLMTGGRKDKIRTYYFKEISDMNCRRADYIEIDTIRRFWKEIDR